MWWFWPSVAAVAAVVAACIYELAHLAPTPLEEREALADVGPLDRDDDL